MRRKIEVLVFLAVVLMMYLYPLSIVPLLLLAREWKEFRENWRKAEIVLGVSIPLYLAKIPLGISGWAETLGISPVQVSPVIWWGVYLSFTLLQTLAVYYIYLVGKKARGLRRGWRSGDVACRSASLAEPQTILCPHMDRFGTVLGGG